MLSVQYRKIVLAACLLATLFSVLSACHSSASTVGKTVTLTLGGYTTPREAYSKTILPAFQNYWRVKTGQTVEFQESYQASGAQSRAILAGFEADIAALSLEGDLDRLAQAGLITHDWRANQHRGIVSTSVVVLAVRTGNPRGIRDWDDLTQPGLNVLTPDPKTSGGAQWNIVALYGAARRGFTSAAKDDPVAARDLLKRVLGNVSVMDKGARESITNFERGIGDVAITYENEVIVGRQAGRQYDYVVPRSTVLIENPVALVDTYVDKHGVRAAAEAFIQFLWQPETQRAYAQYGLRPVHASGPTNETAQFPAVTDLWTISYLGGWRAVQKDLFGSAGAYAKTFAELHGGQ